MNDSSETSGPQAPHMVIWAATLPGEKDKNGKVTAIAAFSTFQLQNEKIRIGRLAAIPTAFPAVTTAVSPSRRRQTRIRK